MSKTFALIGAAGYVAPRHLQAISHVGGRLIGALDLHDSVGVLDRYFPDCRFFTSPERFDRFLNKRSGEIDYVVVCSPNWLHDAHCRWALRSGADAICEKPVVLEPWNVDQLMELEIASGRRIHPVLQLRIHPSVVALQSRMGSMCDGHVSVQLTYVTRRGRWYAESWKGVDERSGGIPMNIGIHFFDLACELFGRPRSVHTQRPTKSDDAWRGIVDFDDASMSWLLSTKEEDLPHHVRERDGNAFRSLIVNGDEIDFSDGFEDLHKRVYENVISGSGPSLRDARPGIELVHRIRSDS